MDKKKILGGTQEGEKEKEWWKPTKNWLLKKCLTGWVGVRIKSFCLSGC